ncbi:MAG: polysaccharide biosynthesis/export family protein [Myxococcota bacterium]|nr:polysaccharide biosynthesis/export family protein [Myxococcota bacterium]
MKASFLYWFSCFWMFGCVPNQLRQRHLDEDLWRASVKKSNYEYKLTTVTPRNFQQIQEENQSLFHSRCAADIPFPEHGEYKYTLGVGDEVMIKVNAISGDTDYFSRFGRDLVHILPEREISSILSSYAVDTQGFLSLPYLGKLKAKGMTTYEIQDLLQQQLSIYYNKAFVEVKMYLFKSQWVEVVGAVKKISRLAIDTAPMNVQRALIESGGIVPGASLREAFIQRGKDQQIPIDIYALLFEGDLRHNHRMYHQDVLVIPHTTKDRIFLTGEVSRRRVIETNFHNYFLSDLLIMDGDPVNIGYSNDKNFVYVLRYKDSESIDPHCPEQESLEKPLIHIFKFDMRMPQTLVLAENFLLRERDIVYVSTTTIQNWNRFLEMLLPATISPYLSPFANPSNYGG